MLARLQVAVGAAARPSPPDPHRGAHRQSQAARRPAAKAWDRRRGAAAGRAGAVAAAAGAAAAAAQRARAGGRQRAHGAGGCRRRARGARRRGGRGPADAGAAGAGAAHAKRGTQRAAPEGPVKLVATPVPPSPAPLCLQDLFPGSFTHLVRVHNHRAVDRLLVQHDAAATQRDRLAGAAAQARREAGSAGLGDAGAAAAAAAAPGSADGGAAAGSAGGGTAPKAAARAAARQAAAEAALSLQQARVEQLEEEIEAARQAALRQPLGTAFIALFRWVLGEEGRWALVSLAGPGCPAIENPRLVCRALPRQPVQRGQVVVAQRAWQAPQLAAEAGSAAGGWAEDWPERDRAHPRSHLAPLPSPWRRRYPPHRAATRRLRPWLLWCRRAWCRRRTSMCAPAQASTLFGRSGVLGAHAATCVLQHGSLRRQPPSQQTWRR